MDTDTILWPDDWDWTITREDLEEQARHYAALDRIAEYEAYVVAQAEQGMSEWADDGDLWEEVA